MRDPASGPPPPRGSRHASSGASSTSSSTTVLRRPVRDLMIRSSSTGSVWRPVTELVGYCADGRQEPFGHFHRGVLADWALLESPAAGRPGSGGPRASRSGPCVLSRGSCSTGARSCTPYPGSGSRDGRIGAPRSRRFLVSAQPVSIRRTHAEFILGGDQKRPGSASTSSSEQRERCAVSEAVGRIPRSSSCPCSYSEQLNEAVRPRSCTVLAPRSTRSRKRI